MAVAAVVGFATSPLAKQCLGNRTIYEGINNRENRIEFLNSHSGILYLSKNEFKATYKFSITWSNGFTREYMNLDGKGAPSSSISRFGDNLLPTKSGDDDKYLIVPDLGRDFYYWDEFRLKNPSLPTLPEEGWRLIGCGSPTAHFPMKLER